MEIGTSRIFSDCVFFGTDIIIIQYFDTIMNINAENTFYKFAQDCPTKQASILEHFQFCHNKKRQTGAELGQAWLKLELGFTSTMI